MKSQDLTLDEAFSSFKKSAKRLELLQEYHIEDGGEWEFFQKFQNGENCPLFEELVEWNKMLSTWKSEGKTIERVRLIESPITDYLKYEIYTAYLPSEFAGQKVNFVSREEFDKLNKNNLNKDFWIFDDKYVFEMIYDEKGAFLDAKLVEGSAQKKLYENLKKVSHSMQEVMKQIRMQEIKVKI